MPIGKRVVIIGGGLHGCELAEFLVKAGRKVTMVDSAEILADPRQPMMLNTRLFNWLDRKGAVMLTGVKYEGMSDQGFTIVTREGQWRTIKADTVIPVAPLTANNALAESIKGKAPEIYAIGDCAHEGLIIDAIADGYRVARQI